MSCLRPPTEPWRRKLTGKRVFFYLKRLAKGQPFANYLGTYQGVGCKKNTENRRVSLHTEPIVLREALWACPVTLF